MPGIEQMVRDELWETLTVHCRETLLEDIFQPFFVVLTVGPWIMELGLRHWPRILVRGQVWLLVTNIFLIGR